MGKPKSVNPEMGQPNREFLKLASQKQEFPKWASLEFLNWTSPFLEFPIWVGQYQEFPIIDWPILGISDFGCLTPGFPAWICSIRLRQMGSTNKFNAEKKPFNKHVNCDKSSICHKIANVHFFPFPNFLKSVL